MNSASSLMRPRNFGAPPHFRIDCNPIRAHAVLAEQRCARWGPSESVLASLRAAEGPSAGVRGVRGAWLLRGGRVAAGQGRLGGLPCGGGLRCGLAAQLLKCVVCVCASRHEGVAT